MLKVCGEVILPNVFPGYKRIIFTCNSQRSKCSVQGLLWIQNVVHCIPSSLFSLTQRLIKYNHQNIHHVFMNAINVINIFRSSSEREYLCNDEAEKNKESGWAYVH